MNKVKISIIIPVYNAELYLSRCIDSIIQQTYTDWELLLIDDGSTDKSGVICDDYRDKHTDKIRSFHNQNSGVSAARFFGIRRAGGDYICFVDSDDSLPKDSLNLLYTYSQKYQADILIGGYTKFYLNQSFDYYGFTENECSGEELLFSLLSGNWRISGPWAKFFKHELFLEELPDIPRKIYVGEDLMMNVCLASRANTVAFIPFSVYNYCQVETSTMHSFTYTIEYMKLYVEKLEQLLGKIKVDRANELLCHYKINMMYGVILDDLCDDINYKSEILSFIGEIQVALTKRERLILYMLKYRGFRVVCRRILLGYRNRNRILYYCIKLCKKADALM